MLYCTNCNNKLYNEERFCPKCGNQNLTKINKNNSNKTKKIIGTIASIISLITAIIPLLIIGYCYTYSNGSFSEEGEGFIWFFATLYYISIGIPIAITSTITGIIGTILKNIIGIIAIILNIIHFIIIYNIIT